MPWEFLYDPRHNRFLAQSRRTPLIRYLDLPDPPHPLSVEGPLRLLVMISSPSGYTPLDVEQEWEALTGALAEQQAQGRVIVERLAATMSELRTRLRRQEFHVFHFVGHGFWHRDWRDGVLVMEDRHGRPHEVTGEDLGGLLSEYDQTRLAVLNACEGARSEDFSDPFAGMAQSLIQQGLPAVVAMQFEITDDAAIIFARELYAAIADGYPVEGALASARLAILHDGNQTEWGTPVLYSRAPDGNLFNLASRAPIPEADRQAREEADRQARELATHYALASAAAETRDWDQALTRFTMIADIDPGYRDVQERRKNAQKQQEIARWQAEARRLHQAAQWAAVVKIGRQLHALDPAASDPDGLMTSARAEVAAEEQSKRLDVDYENALRLLDAGDWRQAIAALERVAQVNPAYRATPVLLDQARRQLADTGPAQRPKSVSRPVTAGNSEAESTPRLDRTLTGHKGLISRGVLSVAFSPDGRLLASSGEDRTVRLWESATGTHRRVLTGHTGRPGPVHCVAFSPDGRLLASGGTDKTVRLWDPATGTQQRVLTGHSGGVSSVAFSPDGRLLASSDDGVWLWDPATGEHRRTLTGDTWMVHGVAFSPDGRLLASGGTDKTVRLWDPATGIQRRVLTGHRSGVHSVAFSPDGRLLASGGTDKTVRLWDPATGSEQRILTGHSGGVHSVAFSPDGRLLASGGDKTVLLWDLATGEQRRTLSGHTSFVFGVAFSPDGRLLASGSGDKTVRLWDLTRPAAG